MNSLGLNASRQPRINYPFLEYNASNALEEVIHTVSKLENLATSLSTIRANKRKRTTAQKPTPMLRLPVEKKYQGIEMTLKIKN